MGTAIKHPVPDRVKPSFVIFDTLTLSPERQSARMSKITNDDSIWHRMLYSCNHMATVGVKGIMTLVHLNQSMSFCRLVKVGQIAHHVNEQPERPHIQLDQWTSHHVNRRIIPHVRR